ncbi:class I SAM-dependent methyltransferase [Metarhizobium album]|nr:class I SAM-dependent methyltransferase [Rhizobium album]
MMQDSHSHFANPAAIESYARDVPLRVPGLHDLHRMTMLLLAEEASETAHILVVGAGGGMETKSLAEAQPGWRFVGVDPSPAMLNLARQTVMPFADRVDLLEGTVDRAPDGPFDGATCLLTLHHMNRSEQMHTLRGIHRRLRPGARLVIANHSAPGPDPDCWMTRTAAFALRDRPDWAKAAAAAKTIGQRLTLLTPPEEEDMLREVGFVNIGLFYAAFSFRGWVATANNGNETPTQG